ncbi:MAG TPA: PaaI family thioesterase [Candidatus Eisenbacteria bacterium]|nr:PaaI family thioesterase [Candidatus Eisenbacteria bacterium]
MPGMEARNPDFERTVRESFSKQRIMATLGASLERVGAGEAEIHLPSRADLTQQHGFMHAGIVATILDSACGYAAFSLMSAGSGVLSVEFKINLLAPARGDLLIARARVLRAGRTITACHAEGHMRTEGETVLVAAMQATIMTIEGRAEVTG